MSITKIDTDNDTFQIDGEDLRNIREFIRSTLYSDWDRYTDHHICPNVPLEEGMRRMNADMYDFANHIDEVT